MTKKRLLADENHLRFSELIQTRTGIRVGESRQEVLARALKESAKSAACADLNQFFLCLQDARTDSEVWNDLVKKVTIGETYFFRDPDTIEALRNNILPDLIARHRSDRMLRLWSAGCATGEEPYTLAILLLQLLSNIGQWKILILATDINRKALSHAAAGRYREWSFRETNPAIRSAYFDPEGQVFTLRPAVRERVTFAYHNLAEDNYPSPANQTGNLDLILCRNVTIYLPGSLIQEMANRFHQCLSEGGWLIVGPSETHLEIYNRFQTVRFQGTITYRKASDIPLSPMLQTNASGKIQQGLPHPQLEKPPVMSSTRHAVPAASGAKGTPLTTNPQSPPVDQPLLASLLHPAYDIPIGNSPKTGNFTTDGEMNLYQQGEGLMRQHRYDEARQCFLSLLEKKPGSTMALHRMARLEANAGRLSEARGWAQKGLDQDPLLSETHYLLALIHELQEEVQEALDCLKKAIYLDADFVLAHFGLFHLYERTGNPIKAERHRVLAVHLASKLSPDTVLPGSDDLTAGQLLAMAQSAPHNRFSRRGGTS
ncbi:MAG: hypothetical protein A2170_10820 [Deltaproteobacteria bacterium RBG_13_53_10]|nr:MAG: hypothetical protein A2170_10820 [Deltaproteobacteria bacterium RBG_13_53_10]